MGKEYIAIAATTLEMRAVMQGLGIESPVAEPGEGLSHTVQSKGRTVRLVVSGVGPLASAFAAGCLAGEGALSYEKCMGLICLGIAGAYVPSVTPLGAAIRVTREIWPEYGLVTESGIDPVRLGFPLAGKKGDTAPPPVWDVIDLDMNAYEAMGLCDPIAAPHLPENPLVFSGPSVTVAGVSGTRSRARELATKYTALTENMEGFPLALAACGARVPFVEMRTISNIVGDRTPSAWNIPAALAALTRITALVFS